MLWLSLAAVAAGIAIGIPFSIWATAHVRKNKKAYAVASALIFSFGLYNPNAEKIVEAAEDTEEAKRQRAGDPPVP